MERPFQTASRPDQRARSRAMIASPNRSSRTRAATAMRSRGGDPGQTNSAQPSKARRASRGSDALHASSTACRAAEVFGGDSPAGVPARGSMPRRRPRVR